MQLGLFDSPAQTIPLEDVILFALGEFQSRGHKLAGRELALDRLRHAIDRSFRKFSVEEMTDEIIAESLKKLGAIVTELPQYIAKRPYRVSVPAELAEAASQVFRMAS